MTPGTFRAVVATAALHLIGPASSARAGVFGDTGLSLSPHPAGTLSSRGILSPILQAGHPAPDPGSGILPDSPDIRVDPNTTTSPFAGVGSLFADVDPTDPYGVICTGTAISRTTILTAAHCVDVLHGDGIADVAPENLLFILNFGGDFTHIIPAQNIYVHPGYDGSLSDDLAVIELSAPLPDGVPIYPLADPGWLDLAPVILAGYGDSGDGVNGYSPDSQAEFHIKRTGANLLEYAELDDDGGSEVEIVAWDFEYEGDPERFDIFGVPFALPNHLETTLGGGDSGGPGFMLNPNDPNDDTLYLAVVNTFSFVLPGVPDHDVPGAFGSGSGGIWLNAEYQKWILGIPEPSTWVAAALVLGLTVARCRRPST